MSKYLLEKKADLLSPEDQITGLEVRPTQTDLRDRGTGEYQLRRGSDASLIKSFTVFLNRNNNPAITGHSPVNLDGISTLNLNRMVRAYGVIVKNWPAKQTDLNKITAELQKRADLLDLNRITLEMRKPVKPKRQKVTS